MLVQALADYADTYLSDQLSDEAFEEKPVPYLIELDGEGTFLNITHNNVSAVRGKKTVAVPSPLLIPKSAVARTSPSKSYPLLAADSIQYVLGTGPWTKDGDEVKELRHHNYFIELLNGAASQTNDEALLAAVRFYDREEEVLRASEALSKASPGAIVALSVNGPLVKRAEVREFWRNHFRKAARGRVAKGDEMECLISGRTGPIARTHDKIKGLGNLGGRPEVSLMSFDKKAFRSYGWEQNANSPVAPDRAMAYVLGLNDLLRRDGGHRRDIAGVGFLFWTKEKTELDPMLSIDQPEASQVARLLQFEQVELDPNMFYMIGVAGNGGRMLIRYWVAESLTEVKGNLKEWFSGLLVADAYSGKRSEYPSLWQLRRAIHREPEDVPADRVVALIRRAIEGRKQPLGYRMLSAALARLRVSSEKRLDTARMGLIRLCINDQIGVRNEGESLMTESLDPQQRHKAYLCGRLLAVYESLQYAASKEVNQTVTDRYYTLASTYPTLAFPKLEDLGNKHLRKLRRENPGAKWRIDQELGTLHGEIEEASGFRFPEALDLDGQGRFALGYHHQRAHQMAQIQARKNQAVVAGSEANLEDEKEEN